MCLYACSKSKNRKIQSLGAELEIYGESQDSAEQRCYQLMKEQGLTLIPPFDHPHVIAGQGTISLEILEDLPTVNGVIGGLSGGGLLSGIGLVMKSTNPDIQVIGVSMENGAAMYESLKADKPVEVSEFPTLADSLLGGIGVNNNYTFNMIKSFIDKSYLVPEESIKKEWLIYIKNIKLLLKVQQQLELVQFWTISYMCSRIQNWLSSLLAATLT